MDARRPGHYFEIELEPGLRKSLLALLRGKQVEGRAIRKVELAVIAARKVDIPWWPEALDWKDVADEAKREGCSEADVVFDRMAK